MEIVKTFEKILSEFNAKGYVYPVSVGTLDFTMIRETSITRKMERELKTFFYNNRERIDAFIWHYEKFKREIQRKREKFLYKCLKEVRLETGKDWRIYQDWDLCISFNDEKRKSRIGIETRFMGETSDNPLGDFCIYITVWEKKYFDAYEDELKEAFPKEKGKDKELFVDDESWGANRKVLRVGEIPADDDHIDQIVAELKETYDKLEPIAAEHK
ncbi:MAG: hypothetical protein K2I87_06690 [Bacteroidales bacterium]|nr:hypothetical protein [Bacteroidales bacterium]